MVEKYVLQNKSCKAESVGIFKFLNPEIADSVKIVSFPKKDICFLKSSKICYRNVCLVSNKTTPKKEQNTK